MTLFDFDVDAVPDVKLLDKGEYELTCQAAELKETQGKDDKPKRTMIVLRLICAEHPESDAIFHNLCSHVASDEDRTKLMLRRNIKDAVLGFGVSNPNGKLVVEEFVGKSAWANVDVEDDGNGKMRNTVKSFTRRA